MFKVSFFYYFFVRNMIKLIISCLNVSFKKLIVWLRLHPKLIASDYITTGRPLGRTKGVHSCVTPQGALSGGCEAWLANPSSLTYFNTNGRVGGLGKPADMGPMRRHRRTHDQLGTAETELTKLMQYDTMDAIHNVYPADKGIHWIHAVLIMLLLTSTFMKYRHHNWKVFSLGIFCMNKPNRY